MSSPKVVVQIVLSGAQILGKAFWAAGKQAAKNAKSSPQGALASDAAGVSHANSGSPTDQLTRLHRMTLDEAHLILNLKRGEEVTSEKILANYEHMFKANSPPAVAPKPAKPAAGKRAPFQAHSHYVQSKVVRARERIEAEMKIAQQEEAAAPTVAESTPQPPPAPSPSEKGSS